jgi:SAM-dependent methyltransferase
MNSLLNPPLAPDREAFRRHYDVALSDWGGHSGAGSDAFHTTPYRAFVDRFMRMNGVRNVVDVGCGDWQFSRLMNFDGIDYLGLDVVPELVARNQERFGGPGRRFAEMPATLANVPGGDLLLMKDVLQHLPDATIAAFATEVVPRFRWALLTNSFEKLDTPRNTDTEAGGFRCLDLAAAPHGWRGAYVLEFSSPLWERIRSFLVG